MSLAFGRAASEAGIAVSMGSRGDAYDCAVAETFFAILKKELVNRRSWPDRLELQSAVFEYIEAFYTASAGTPPSRYSPRSPTNTYGSRRSVVEINRSNNNNQHQHQVSRKPGQVHATRSALAVTRAHTVCGETKACAAPVTPQSTTRVLMERGMDSSTVEGGQSAIPRRPRRGAGPVSVDGSAWPVLERLLDDEEQQSDCYERDPDRVTEADHCAGNHEHDRDQA